MTEIKNTSAMVLWEAVEDSKRNSEISGYILQYTSSDTKVTNSKSVNSPTTFEVQIRFVYNTSRAWFSGVFCHN